MLLSCLLYGSSWLVLLNIVHAYPEGAVRLSREFQQKSGLVEVFIDDLWIPIADEDWEEEDARVICRQLGHSEVAELLGADDLCPITGGDGFVIDQVNCSGEEAAISECTYTTMSLSSSMSPSGVTCADEGDIRLVNRTKNGGLVEILKNGEWMSLCGDTVSVSSVSSSSSSSPATDANTMCNQLGFEQGVITLKNSTESATGSGSGSGYLICPSIVMLQCSGPPAQPCPPVLKSITCNSISVTINETSSLSTAAVSYRLRYRIVNNNVQTAQYTLLNQTNDTSLVSVTDLCPATLYEVQVQAVNSDGGSAWSVSLFVRTELIELATPTALAFDVISPTTTNITWNVVSTCGSEFITIYDVVVDSMDDDSSSNVLHTSSHPSLLLTDLQPSSSYTIKVRSVRDSTGSSLHYDSTCKTGSAISSFSTIYNLTLPSPVIQLNSSLQAHLTDRPSEVLLEASWTMNCSDFQQDSDSCFGLVDHFTLRCRQDSSMEEEIVEGRSQCDGVVSKGKVSVTGLESSRYLCNLTALSSEGDIVAEDELNISTPQTIPQGLKVDSISETNFTLKWNYTKLTDVHHGFLVTVSSVSAITFKSRRQLLNSTVLEGERPEYLHPINQLVPGQTYEINLAVVIHNRTGPDVKIFASTLQQAPICAPLQLNYTTNSSSSVTTTINFTWVSNNDASCGDSDILGQVIYCSSNQTRNSLSYIVLPSSSKYSLTVTQQDAQHFVNLSCYVTHFNGAGEGPKSKSVTLHPQVIPSGVVVPNMTSSILSDLEPTRSTVTPSTQLNINADINLTLLVILIVLVTIIVVVFISFFGFVMYHYRHRLHNKKKRRRRIGQTHSTSTPSPEMYNIYQLGEPVEESYIPMASTSSLFSRNRQRNLWIDTSETPQASSFMPINENHTSNQHRASNTGSVASTVASSEKNEEREEKEKREVKEVKEEESTYDEVGAQVAAEMKVIISQRGGIGEGGARGGGGGKEDLENLYDEIIPNVRASRLSDGGGEGECSQSSNIIPPPTQFSELPRRPSLPNSIYSQVRVRRPPPRRPTVGAKLPTLHIPLNDPTVENKEKESKPKEPTAEGDENDAHYSVPSNRPLLVDPNTSPQYEVILNPSHLAILLKNEGAEDDEEEDKSNNITTES